jgi:GTP-binding protein
LLDQLPAPEPAVEERVRVTRVEEPRFTVSRRDGVFVVEGREIERHVAMTDLENEEAVERLQRIISRMGLEEALKEAGVREGDTVRIGKFEFTYME